MLQEKLKGLGAASVRPSSEKLSAEIFRTDIRIGELLDSFVSPVRNYKKRTIYGELESYVHGTSSDKVFVLYGLRRTGKTTLIRQVILNMTEAERARSAFLQVSERNTLGDVSRDLILS